MQNHSHSFSETPRLPEMFCTAGPKISIFKIVTCVVKSPFPKFLQETRKTFARLKYDWHGNAFITFQRFQVDVRSAAE